MLDLIQGKSKEVQMDSLAWFRAAKAADWGDFQAVRKDFPSVDLVGGLPVFNIRHNRYRLIVSVFGRRKLYVKALLSHSEYDRKEWQHLWP